MSWCSRSGRVLTGAVLVLRFVLGLLLGEVLPQALGPQGPVGPDVVPQGPGEGLPALGERQAGARGVQVGPSTRCGARRIGHDGPGTGLAVRVRPGDQPQQLTL